jgi:predicted permease
MLDLRHALRSLAQRPLFTTVAVLSLALGIGVNTAIFSMFDRLLLRPLPVPSPDEIVLVTAPGPRPGGRTVSPVGGLNAIFSYPLFRDLEQFQNTGLRLAAHREFTANLAYRGQTSEVSGTFVSGWYFPALGITPALGRLFGPEDDRVPGGHPLVVLSYDYWNTRFGADPRVLNDTLLVNGAPRTIVGVAPRGFTGTTITERSTIFTPLAMSQRANSDGLTARNIHWLFVFGRLEPGVSRENAERRINSPFAALTRDVELPALQSEMSELARQQFRERRIVLQDGSLSRAGDRSPLRNGFVLMFIVTGFVLAIACANVANLLLTRVTDRAPEMALRLSLGASAGRIVRLLLIEAALLGVSGGVGALVVARMTLAGLSTLAPPQFSAMLGFELDTTLLLFAVALGLTTSLFFGLFPALHSVPAAVATGVHAQSSRVSGSRAANRFRASMATTQIALATALLAVAGLFVVSLVNISRIELGIRREGLLSFRLSPELNGYTPEQSRSFFARAEEELRGLPGVVEVTATTVSLFSTDSTANFLTVEGFDVGLDADTRASYARIGTNYFRTMGVAIIAGRDFAEADNDTSPRVAIVNEAFARKFNLGSRAVGARMALGRGKMGQLDIEIVGLVRDVKYNRVKDAPPPQFYLPYRQSNAGSLTFYVRNEDDSRPLVGMIPPVVARLDANLPMANVRTIDDQVRESTSQDRLVTMLSSWFGGLAVMLAAIGLYAVLAYGVARRLREIGIRIALGATSADVRRLVFGQVGRVSIVGVIVGVALAAGLGRLGRAMLFEVEGQNASIMGGAALLVLTVVVIAGILPVRRATSVDPVTVLRAE